MHVSSQKFVNDEGNVVKSMREIDSGKSLEFLATFAIQEMEKHRDASGKQKDQSVMKAMIQRRKLNEERFLSSDSVSTAKAKDHFAVKYECQESMKKVSSKLILKPDLLKCSHVMAILFELADYFLRS